jgi:hypothetical protein
MAHDIFISHSAHDKAVADAVCAALENAGIRCWIAPRDVQLGRSFAGEITRAIQQSKAMVLIFSAHSNNSEQVLREVQLAVTSHLHIVQFRIEDVLPNDDLTYYLSTPHWLDALTPPLENHLQRLVTSIKALLNAPGEESTKSAAAAATPVPARKQQLSLRMLWIALALAIVGGIGALYYFKVAAPKVDDRSRPVAEPLAHSEPKPSVAPSASNEVVIEFPDVDTNAAPGHVVAAAPYLHRVGISITNLQPKGSEVVLINNRALYEGQAVMPATSQNLFTQIETGNVPASFTLNFAEPVESVSFTRPALYPATESGITHPAWSAHALDAQGQEVSSQSEGLTRSFSDVPAQRYTLRAPGFDRIAALRFDSDPRLNGRPFAGFSAILIERLTLTRPFPAK